MRIIIYTIYVIDSSREVWRDAVPPKTLLSALVGGGAADKSGKKGFWRDCVPPNLP